MYTILIDGAGKYAHVFPGHLRRCNGYGELLSRRCHAGGAPERRRFEVAGRAGARQM